MARSQAREANGAAGDVLSREVGYIRKPHGGRLRVALAFPNTYFVGMSNLGFQTVYLGVIPIPDLLLRLRNRAKEENVPSPGTPPMGAWALLASQPTAWKAALTGGKILNYMPTKLLPIPALRAWESQRALPAWRGGEFRKWMKNRKR